MINYAILRHFYIIYDKSNTNNGSRKLWILKLNFFISITFYFFIMKYSTVSIIRL